MKQETLEEVLLFPLIIENGMDYLNFTTKILNNGAKWQQERSYSKEEVYNITQQLKLKLKTGVLKWQDDFEFDLEKWFEQFKK